MSHLDNDKEEIQQKLWSALRTDKRADTYVIPTRVMELISEVALAHTQSKLKAFAGEVEALLANSEYIPGNPLLGKLAPRPKRSIDSENELKSDLRESLKAIKEKAGIE